MKATEFAAFEKTVSVTEESSHILRIQPKGAECLNDPGEYCTRCDAPIVWLFIVESEAKAPYQPKPYCSAECRDLAIEDTYQHTQEAM